MTIVIAVVLVAWITCGVFAYGLTLAYFQKRFQLIAEEFFYEDRRHALLMGVIGPFGLIIVLMNRTARTGLLFQWRKS